MKVIRRHGRRHRPLHALDGRSGIQEPNPRGQGYTDLDFLTPELIQGIEYFKGPYSVAEGDFASAGSAGMHCATSLRKSFVELNGGSFGYGRAVVAGSPSIAWREPFVRARSISRGRPLGPRRRLPAAERGSLLLAHPACRDDRMGGSPRPHRSGGALPHGGAPAARDRCAATSFARRAALSSPRPGRG
jgi:hypothetical protein